MKVAFLMTDGFDDREFRQPYDDVRAAQLEAVIVGPVAGADLVGKLGVERVRVDVGVDEVRADDFAGVVVPGGHSPDRLRTVAPAVALVADVHRAGGLTAAICHGPWLLIEAGVVRGRRLTGWVSVRTDVVNAGGTWVDAEVVEDDNLVTSRRPEDVDAFSRAILRRLPRARA